MPDGSIMFCCPAPPLSVVILSPIPPRSHTTKPAPTSTPAHTPTSPFRLSDLAYELQEIILDFVADMAPFDLCNVARVSHEWHARFVPLLYSSLSITKANRERVFAGLGLDYLTPTALESRSSEDAGRGCAAYAAQGPNRKNSALAHVKRLGVADSGAAVSLAEALMTHGDLLPQVEELHLGAQMFRYLVNSIATFGRPRSGSAFVGETLVARLRPRRLLIDFPPSRGHAGTLDPILLARVTTVLLTDWAPESVDYFGVGLNLPPALGPLSRIHYTTPCTPFDDVWEDGEEDMAGGGCHDHSLVRMHLRRTFGQHARSELLEAVAEAADPTDDDDLDPDLIPDPAHARVEYYGVPCIAAADRDAFLDRTFTYWPVEVDVAAHVAFYP